MTTALRHDADRIYLYELTGQKVIAETEYPDSNGGGENIRTWVMDSGYCIAYEAVSESSETETGITESVIFGEGEAAITGSFHIIYAYYDTDLNFQKTIDVTALGADVNFIHQTAPSGDGRQIWKPSGEDTFGASADLHGDHRLCGECAEPEAEREYLSYVDRPY